MYERSAIVLERYFHNLLGYFSENNLKVNFENYCSLVEKLDRFEQCFEEEQIAIQEFEEITDRLKTIQKNQEKLYKKSAKLEYNRNILFNNIEDKTENIEHCMIKIENDIDKNSENFKGLRKDFISTLNEYKQKNSVLNKSKKAKRESEKLYREILETSQENIDNINEFVLEIARNFNGAEMREKLLKLMLDNGKEEKIPFDEEVIGLAIDFGIDIERKEVQCYIDAYDSILSLFVEIEKDEVKLEKFKRKLKNAKVMLHFLEAEKEYLVQFLDYERMMSISGKRTHKKLMEQACENFKLDVVQISHLYELIEKEVANKSSQKTYKELYNKSYLLQMKREEESLKKEKTKVDTAVATVLGSNYWRIEGIKNIYTVFYKEVSEVFGRDLDEFDVPENDEIEVVLEKEKKAEKSIEIIEPQKENIKYIEEIDEDELPQLISEDDIEPEIETVANEIVKEIKKAKVELPEKIEEVVITETVKQRKTRKDIIKEEEEKKNEKVQVIEKSKERKTRKDIIKEEEEKKKLEKVKIKEQAKNKKQQEKLEETKKNKKEEVKIIDEEKKEQLDNISITEPVKERRTRRDIIKEEEEKKKKKSKIKEELKENKKEKIQIIEEKEEEPQEEIKLVEEKIPETKKVKEEKLHDETLLEDNVVAIETLEDVSGEEIYDEEEEESLFGNIKNTKTSRRKKIDLEMLEQLEIKNKSNKKGIFNSLLKMNSNKGKRVAD